MVLRGGGWLSRGKYGAAYTRTIQSAISIVYAQSAPRFQDVCWLRVSGQRCLRSYARINGIYLALQTKRLHRPPYMSGLDTFHRT